MSITLPKLPMLDLSRDNLYGYTADQMHAHAAAVSAAKDAEIAQLRAELLKSLADNAALRERVRVLEDALREYIAAADNSMTTSDDVAAMLRFGDADKAARATLEQKP